MNKKVIAGLAAITLSVAFFQTAHSQIEIKEKPKAVTLGKVKSGSALIAELTYTVEDKDTLFTIFYNNAEYKTLTDIQAIVFDGQDNTFGKFYDVLKSFFSDENKKNKEYAVSLKLGGKNVNLMNMRVMGTTSVMVHGEKGYFYLTEKQVDKLFGK